MYLYLCLVDAVGLVEGAGSQSAFVSPGALGWAEVGRLAVVGEGPRVEVHPVDGGFVAAGDGW